MAAKQNIIIGEKEGEKEVIDLITPGKPPAKKKEIIDIITPGKPPIQVVVKKEAIKYPIREKKDGSNYCADIPPLEDSLLPSKMIDYYKQLGRTFLELDRSSLLEIV